MRKVLAVLVLLLLIAGGVWVMAGRQEGPTLTFTKPGALIGQSQCNRPANTGCSARDERNFSMDLTHCC